ncbi:MAG: hypothetical protein AAGB51_01995 [Planctomycetota bacterium]
MSGDAPEIENPELGLLMGPPAPTKHAEGGSLPPEELDVFGKPPPPGTRDWSHRKGEPRMLAFFWCMILLAATLGTFWIAGRGGLISTESYRAAARGLLLVVTLGLAVIWPVIRLSQLRPIRESGVVVVLKDIAVLLVPVQAIVWTQLFLARWPVSALLAVTAAIGAWSLVAGGLVALAIGPSRDSAEPISKPAAWTLLLGFLVLAAPVASVFVGMQAGVMLQEGPNWLLASSPVTVIHELLRDRTGEGVAVRIEEQHWAALAGTGALGLLMAHIAIVRAVAGRRQAA